MGLLDEEFLTVAEIAAMLKLNQQTVRNWIDDGFLPAHRIGRRVRVTRSDLERVIEQGRTQPAAAQTAAPAAAKDFWGGGPLPAPAEPPKRG